MPKPFLHRKNGLKLFKMEWLPSSASIDCFCFSWTKIFMKFSKHMNCSISFLLNSIMTDDSLMKKSARKVSKDSFNLIQRFDSIWVAATCLIELSESEILSWRQQLHSQIAVLKELTWGFTSFEVRLIKVLTKILLRSFRN